MSEPRTRPARLQLPAAGSVAANVHVVHHARRRRALRAGVILGGAVAVMPLVFVIPPHLLWPVLVLGAGLYFARREWVGEYEVVRFEGACPRCGDPLSVEPGTRIRGRQRLECYGCHREPELVLEAGDG